MKHSSFLLIVIMLINYSCITQKSPYKIELKEELMEIIDSFTNQYTYYQYYELYIDKIDPHNTIIMLSGGDNSRTEEENCDYNEKSHFYVNSNNKRVEIYSGLERYMNNEYGDSIEQKKHQNLYNSVCWIVKDSFHIMSIDSIYGVYPFMPLPLKIDIPAGADLQSAPTN
jgi:hypothetical protein